MQKLRSTWLALMGGAFLVALSVSAAFGAPPTGTDGPRGQTVATFVHELVFGADEETDADEVANETEDEAVEEGSEELAVEEDELVEDGEVADSHDECVSEEASDKTDETEADGNHGAVVSFAAQETCWVTESGAVITDPEEEELEEQVVEEETEREVPEGFANHGECVSAAAQDWDSEGSTDAANHGEWVSDHARYICWGLPVPGAEATEESSLEDETDAADLTAKEERKAEQTAARAERKADRAAAHAAKPKAGNGRGGGRP